MPLPAAGVVTVAVARRAASVVLEVVDDGPGIGSLSAEALFNRFQRGDTGSQCGAGLGLAIVKEIADRHLASVSCDRANESGGFRVTLEFPALALAANAAERDSGAPQVSAAAGSSPPLIGQSAPTAALKR